MSLGCGNAEQLPLLAKAFQWCFIEVGSSHNRVCVSGFVSPLLFCFLHIYIYIYTHTHTPTHPDDNLRPQESFLSPTLEAVAFCEHQRIGISPSLQGNAFFVLPQPSLGKGRFFPHIPSCGNPHLSNPEKGGFGWRSRPETPPNSPVSGTLIPLPFFFSKGHLLCPEEGDVLSWKLLGHILLFLLIVV